MIDKVLLARRFGRAAPGYQRHARVQERAAAALVEAAQRHGGRPPRRLLDVGCGTGLLTARLLDAWPGAAALGLDLSAEMAAEAGRRLAGRGVRFTVSDIERGYPEERFDLVASSMALQWVEDPAAVLRGAAAQLSEEGLLALAVPTAGTLIELRIAYAAAVAELGLGEWRGVWRYPGLAFHGADRWAAWARAAFREVALREELVVERHQDARAVLESIRGVGGNDCGGGAGQAAVRLLRRALARYDAEHRGAAGVPATWRLAVVTARGPRREAA